MKSSNAQKRIVYLDRNSLPERIDIPPPRHAHHWQNHAFTPPDKVIERSREADILVVNKVPIGRTILNACPTVRHIAVTATGYNIIDIEACREMGVSVSHIPSYAATTVAEHVIGCCLTLRRQLSIYRQRVIEGAWQQSPTFCLFDKPIHNVSGAVFGIIGFGAIGQQVAKLTNALGMQVIYYSRNKHHCQYAEAVSLSQLIARCDVISVHCALNDETQNLLGAKEFAQMKSDVVLINTARGGIINEFEVVDALEQGIIGGIAFDVLTQEPPTEASPLLRIAKRHNVIITPHIAWASEQAMQHLATVLSANIDAFLSGTPQNIVT